MTPTEDLFDDPEAMDEESMLDEEELGGNEDFDVSPPEESDEFETDPFEV